MLNKTQSEHCKLQGYFNLVIDGCKYRFIWDYRTDEPILDQGLNKDVRREIEEARARKAGAIFA